MSSTNDRMVDVLGKLLAQLRSDFIIGLAAVPIGGCEALQVRYGFDVPYDYVRHDIQRNSMWRTGDL